MTWDGKDRRRVIEVDDDTQCGQHGEFVEQITGLRSDVKWFVRIGAGIFSICGIVTTCLAPSIVNIYEQMNTYKRELVLLQKDMKEQQELSARIIAQRNMDHPNPHFKLQ